VEEGSEILVSPETAVTQPYFAGVEILDQVSKNIQA
jgi:hypothetical protein